MEQRQKPRIVQDGLQPIAEFYVGGTTYRLSLLGLPVSQQNWTLAVIDQQMQEIHEQAYLKGKKEIINEHRRMLRLEEI